MDLWTQTQDTERSPGRTGAAPGLSNGESRSEEKPPCGGSHIWVRFGFKVPQKDLCFFSFLKLPAPLLPKFMLQCMGSDWGTSQEPRKGQGVGSCPRSSSGCQVLAEGPPRGHRGPVPRVSGWVFCRCSADWLTTLSHALEMG